MVDEASVASRGRLQPANIGTAEPPSRVGRTGRNTVRYARIAAERKTLALWGGDGMLCIVRADFGCFDRELSEFLEERMPLDIVVARLTNRANGK